MNVVRKESTRELPSSHLKRVERYSSSRSSTFWQQLSFYEWMLVAGSLMVLVGVSFATIFLKSKQEDILNEIVSYQEQEINYLDQIDILEQKIEHQHDYDRVLDAAEAQDMSIAKERIRTISP